MKNSTIVTALDIGTTKICSLIGLMREDGFIEILGSGVSEALGLEKGIVKDIARAGASIAESLRQAEEEAGVKADNIYAGIAGDHIKSQNSEGKISLSGASGRQEPREITQAQVDQVLADAETNIRVQRENQNLEIIHSIPQFYDIDDQKGVLNPIAMSGFHLKAHVHVVMANVNALRNIHKCIQTAGYNARGIVLEPIAAARAVLNEDEFQLGCILLDIGGGTTNIAVYHRGTIRFTSIKPIGGVNITQDLAIGLRTPIANAEKIKISHGNAQSTNIDEAATLMVEGIGRSETSDKKLRFIAEIIEFRMRETLELAYKTVINSYNKDFMTAGVILTGGSSMLRDLDNLAAEIFNLPVRIGYPNLKRVASADPKFNNPRFATAVGLLYYGMDELPVTGGGRQGNRGSDTNLKQSFHSFWLKIKEFLT